MVERINAAFHVPVWILITSELQLRWRRDDGYWLLSNIVGQTSVGDEPSTSTELEVGPPNVDTFLEAEFVFLESRRESRATCAPVLLFAWSLRDR